MYALPILEISETDTIFSAAKPFFAYGKEENLVLPRAEKYLTKDDWEIIDAAFAVNRESAW